MKHIRIFCFSLLALCCIGTMAAGKKKTKNKVKIIMVRDIVKGGVNNG